MKKEEGGSSGAGTNWCSLQTSVAHSDGECKVQQQQQEEEANNGRANVASIQRLWQHA